MDLVFNPLEYRTQDDPYPVYARLREEAPLYHNEDLDFWALSRYRDIEKCLRDFTRFSNRNGPLMEKDFWKPDSDGMHSLVAMDPPRHTVYRKLISGSFTQRAVTALEPQIEERAKRYVDEAVERGEFDAMTDVFKKIPLDALAMVVGIPEEDRPHMQRMLDGTIHREDGADFITPEQMQAFEDLTAYYTGLVAERRRRPCDDLLSNVLAAEVEGKRMTDREVVALLHLLGGAGTETTIEMLGNAWYWAWRHPDQRKPALDGEVVPGWVNETLRYDSSVQLAIRVVTEDVEMYGRTIPEGAQMLLLIASGNRDADVFPDPDRYDLNRDAAPILSFSGGPHHCVGHLLARRLAKTTLSELAAASPTTRSTPKA
ncbi:cytochrome P450 [Actinomadura sp. CNU-125]|uniref:cytochrome P450 n=1 Tax=Actinomadura sp. CNU-125 TaxID=1904961 RepID=UPI0021CCA49C|nr:cytochrome P450 [Actinomadura sp. CNU-125]